MKVEKVQNYMILIVEDDRGLAQGIAMALKEENTLFLQAYSLEEARPVELDGNKVDDAYVEEIMQMLGLEKKKYNLPSQLSGGHQPGRLKPFEGEQ